MNSQKFYRLGAEIELKMVYSAREFRETLIKDLVGETVEKILISSTARYDWAKKEGNVMNCSYMGGSVIICLSSKIIEIAVHAEGLIEYGCLISNDALLPLRKVPTKQEEYDGAIYYDLVDEFTLDYQNQKITNASVKRTNLYPFSLSNLDENLADTAAEQWDLPDGLTIYFENGNSFQFIGDDIEYFWMRMQSRKDRINEQTQFTKALTANPPKYDIAGKILWAGLDLNLPCEDDIEENLLSSMFLGFGMTDETVENEGLRKIANGHLVDVIKFVLKSGMDLSTDNDRFGATCLNNLTFCTHDENIVYAAKLLLDNGAKNIAIENNETPLDTIGGEASYLSVCEADHHTENIFCALYEIVEWAGQGRDYHDIDIYFEAKGKRIQRVLHVKDERGIFSINYPTSKHDNCFTSRIYFDLGDLFLSADKWGGFIAYKKIEEDTEDISDMFKNYIGKVITDFEFDHAKIYKTTQENGKDIPTSYGQAIAKITVDDGSWIVFTDNHGEQKDEYVGYFTFGRSDNMGEKKELTETEKKLISLMIEMGFEEKDIMAICVYSEKENVQEKLLQYLLFKGKYATVSDALCYCGTIERAMGKRHQYYPQNLFVRFIRETTDELNKGDYYQVYMVFGIKDVVYYMENEKDEMKEYPAEDFIRLRPSLITYTGVVNRAGEVTETTEGFEVGKQYRVIDEQGVDYILEDGRSIPFFETDEIEFVPAEPKKKNPTTHDNLLHMLRQALEFGDMNHLYGRMTDETVYVSKTKDLTLVGRDNIIDYIEEISKNRIEQDAYSDVVIATATKDDSDGHKEGERFLMMFHEDKTRSSAFLYDDGTFVTKIELDDAWPAYECDKTPVNELGNAPEPKEEPMSEQDKKGKFVGDYLDSLGVHPITVAEAVSDDYFEKSYQIIKENPGISKNEFLSKLGLIEEKD